MKKLSIIIVFVVLIVLGVWLWVGRSNQLPDLQDTSNGKEVMTEELKIETIIEGEGKLSKSGDVLSVHYIGTLEDGTKFDSSVDRGTPFEFTVGVGQVIEGWDKGMIGMKVGEKRKLTIPSMLAYGESSPSPQIPANSILIFEVELLEIK
jgi:FKBP-type peptidyl-prolyl cis-trans isomerase